MTKRYVITGGGGFVGKAIGIALRREGHQVLALGRGSYPELAQYGIEVARVDISSPVQEWGELLRGYDGVFHTAAKVDMWGTREGFYQTNVIGTRNIMTACRECGIRNLVFTSSPSVVHDGKDLVGVSEDYPYPEHFDSFYAETKAIAEREVLSAPAHSDLRTVALRPHLIWGPHDTNLIPTILERAAAGRLTRIGDGDNKVDLTFIEDCVEAHLLAMRAIEQGDDKVIGRAYFISQGDPVNMWDWIDSVLIAHDLPPVKRAVSKAAALRIATVLEGISRLLLTLGVNFKPLLTRFLVSEMSTHHYFSIEAAKRDLGYQPSCSIADAMKKTFGSIA